MGWLISTLAGIICATNAGPTIPQSHPGHAPLAMIGLHTIEPVAELRKILDEEATLRRDITRSGLKPRRLDTLPTLINTSEPQPPAPDSAEQQLHARIVSIRRRYEQLLDRHPDFVPALSAYADFLSYLADEDSAAKYWERVCALMPNNAAAWNNLANIHAHCGQIRLAFDYYQKAVELAPHDPIIQANLGTLLLLFRPDACEHFGITESEVFDRALDCFQKAIELAPNKFDAAREWASAFYLVKPPRIDAAICAWEQTLRHATNNLQQQEVYVHLARWHINAGNTQKATSLLEMVTNPQFGTIKDRLLRKIRIRDHPPADSNDTAVLPSQPAPDAAITARPTETNDNPPH